MSSEPNNSCTRGTSPDRRLVPIYLPQDAVEILDRLAAIFAEEIGGGISRPETLQRITYEAAFRYLKPLCSTRELNEQKNQ